MSTIHTISSQIERVKRFPSLRSLPLIAIGLYDRMAERHRSRVALLELNDDQLKDIGLSRADAWREGMRPFWD